MRKKKLHNICFYIFKYILMLMPLILLLIVEIFPTKKIENYYNGVETSTSESTSSIYFNQFVQNGNFEEDNLGSFNNNTLRLDTSISNNTLSITPSATAVTDNYLQFNFRNYVSLNDIIYIKFQCKSAYSSIQVGMVYKGRTTSSTYYNVFMSSSTYWEDYSYRFSVLDTQALLFRLNLNIADTSISNYYKNIQLFNLSRIFGYGNEPTAEEFDTMFFNDYYNYNTGELLMLKEVDTTTTINETSNIVSSSESREVNTALLTPFTSLYNLSVNDWYMDILDTIGLDTNNEITKYIACMPLWVLWVELFYLIGFCLSLIPKLFNRWLSFDD